MLRGPGAREDADEDGEGVDLAVLPFLEQICPCLACGTPAFHMSRMLLAREKSKSDGRVVRSSPIRVAILRTIITIFGILVNR